MKLGWQELPLQTVARKMTFMSTAATWVGRRGVQGAACVAGLLLHAVFVTHNFPVSSLLSGNPLTSVELSFHLASATEGDAFIAGQHRLWGYSPRLMAGYPFGLWDSVGTRGFEFASACFPMCSPGTAFYLWILLTALLPPLIIAWACHLLGGGRGLTVLCLLLSIAVYQVGDVVSYFWTSGMIAFAFVSSLAILYAALLHRTLVSSQWLFPVAAGGVLAAVVYGHTLVVVPAVAASAAVLWTDRRYLAQGRTWVRLAGFSAVVLVLALPWLLVLWRYRELRGPMEINRIPSGIKYMIMDFFSDRRYLYHFDRRNLFHILVVLAALGSWSAWREGLRAVGALGLTAAGLLGCAYLFPYSRFMNQTEPYRYVASAELFAILPAALGLRCLARRYAESSRTGKVAGLCIALLLLPGLISYGFDLRFRWKRPAQGLDAERMAVVQWLQQRSATPGRVLCEDPGLGNALVYYDSHEIIGGSISDESMLPQAFTAFEPAGIFGSKRRAAAVADGTLAGYLRLYNVAFVVARSRGFAEDMRRLPQILRESTNVGGRVIFQVETNQLGYVWDAEGSGVTVTAEPNRIVIRDAPQRRFVIKYHYLASLQAKGGARIQGRHLLADPVPFIEVDNSIGLSNVEIENVY